MTTIQYVSRIQFDFGALEKLPVELRAADIKRPLIITDRGIENSGILDKVLSTLGQLEYVVFSECPGNPDEASIIVSIDLFNGEKCDGIIGVGGGSPIDLAKATAMILKNGGDFENYSTMNKNPRTINGCIPWVAVPTAAGTGAEVGRAAVITVNDGRKLVTISYEMAPSAVICDPELTIGLPAHMTAATGIDALTHGIEAYVSKLINPPAKAVALDCTRRVFNNLRRAVEDGSDRDARWNMMMGALEGGMALQKSLGAAHAVSLPLGERGLHHGECVGVMIGHVIDFNLDHAKDAYEELSDAIGIESSKLGATIRQLVSDIRLPENLSGLGIEQTDLPDLALASFKDHFTLTNPRSLTSDCYATLLQNAM